MSADLEKLLPCPFCGGGAVISADMNSYPTVACDACGACSGSGDAPGIEAAVRAWNTRALTAENAALRAKAEKLAEAMPDVIGLAQSYLCIIPDRRGHNVEKVEKAEAALTEWGTP